MRKGDEDWVKKCMEYRVEGRRPVRRPRKTWLESVEVDMAELEIDKEDVHDRSKWRRIVNVMKRMSNPIGKRTINRYYIWSMLVIFRGSTDLGLPVVEPSGNKRRLQIEITFILTVCCSSQRVFCLGSVRSG